MFAQINNEYKIHFVPEDKANSNLKQAILCVRCNQLLVQVASYTYPIIIFDADISVIINEELHCMQLIFSNSNVQGSPLIERLKQSSWSWCITSQCDSDIY